MTDYAIIGEGVIGALDGGLPSGADAPWITYVPAWKGRARFYRKRRTRSMRGK